MQAYADNFLAEPFLAWIIPCFLLTLCFLTVMACIHTLTSEEKKLWSLLALVSAIAYTVNGNPKIPSYGNEISPGILKTFPFCCSGLIMHLGSI